MQMRKRHLRKNEYHGQNIEVLETTSSLIVFEYKLRAWSGG